MKRRLSRRGIACSVIVMSTAAMLGSTSGCLAQSESGSGKQGAVSPASRLPIYYRQLMAQYILAHNRYVIRHAMISKPYDR